jgi:aldose 1-epimerase
VDGTRPAPDCKTRTPPAECLGDGELVADAKIGAEGRRVSFEARISAGDHEAVVSTFGAALKSFALSGREFLDTFEKPDENPDARGQILIPFPNRVEDGRYVFEGEELRLPIDEPERGHAIHGFVRWEEWEVSERDETAVTLRHDLLPRPGYPFSLALRIKYELSPRRGLAVAATATNTGYSSLPFGAGYHPYFTVGPQKVDGTLLRVPAATRLELDERLIPRGRVPVEGSELDFREWRGIGERKINACFTDLDFDEDGRTTVVLSHPDGGPEVAVWMDSAHGYVQVYTGDDIPDESRRRKSVAVEPMSCAPNAFNSGEGLRTLEPGESFVGEWGITVTP